MMVDFSFRNSISGKSTLRREKQKLDLRKSVFSFVYWKCFFFFFSDLCSLHLYLLNFVLLGWCPPPKFFPQNT